MSGAWLCVLTPVDVSGFAMTNDLPPQPDRGAQLLRVGQGIGQGKADIGDAPAEIQRLTREKALRAADKVAFEHDADDGLLTGCDL